MSHIHDMSKKNLPLKLTQHLGHALRAERERMGLTQVQAALRAGIGRQKLIEIEKGRPGVAMGTYVAAMAALNLEPTVRAAMVHIDDFPQLKRLAWNRPGARAISGPDALALYERHWDLVSAQEMTEPERELLDGLVEKHGNGILHV